MKETSPKLNNGTIVDNNDDFKIEFDPISDALACLLYTSDAADD